MSNAVARNIGELEQEDAILAIQDGNHGEKHPKTNDYVDDGIPFVMANNLGKGYVDISSCAKISKEQADKLRIGFSKTGDVLLTHKGTIGNVAIVGEVDPYIMLTPQVTYYRVNPEKLSKEYLAYAFRDPVFQANIKSQAQQSTRPYIGITAQRRLSIKWHERPVQNAIVDIIRPYDDLIENNRRRIALLEEAARLLYREWFVHFRFPGHEHVKITDGVPEGWDLTTLGSVATTNPQSHKKDKLPEILNYIDISSVSRGRIDYKTEMNSADAPGRARRIAQHRDTIWSNVRPNLRAYSIVLNPETNDVFSTGFTVIRAEKVSAFYLYFFTTSDSFVDHLINHATGTSYPAVRPEDFEKAEILVPASELMDSFEAFCAPVFDQIEKLKKASSECAKARDLLLPRLMDGQLEV